MGHYKYNVTTGLKTIRTKAKTTIAAIAALAGGLGMAVALPLAAGAAPSNGNGFNANGYNYNARVFSGAADGVDKNLDGTVWGDPTYASDHLVMKWNAAWDACNANGYDNPDYCAGAWVTNEWNGMTPDGSQWTDHVKVIWVGSAGSASPYWVDGGTSIWGNYELIQDQGMAPGHMRYVNTFATPNGLGH